MNKNKTKKFNSRMLQWHSMEALPLLLVFIFSYVPMFGIIIAFKNYRYADGIFGSKWVGFDNFKIFLKSQDIWNVVGNTLFLNSLFIVADILAAIVLALLLFELKSKTTFKIYQTMYITPNFVSWVVGGYVVYALLNPSYGIINSFLTSVGLPAVQWYTEPKLWPGILTIASVWKGVGMRAIMYYASLMGLDPSLFEAAEIDGASKLQKTLNITLPCLASIISISLILSIGGILGGDFGLFYQLTRNVGELRQSTDVIATYTYRMFRENNKPALSSAIGLMQSVIGFILVVITNAITKRMNEETGLF